MTVQLIQLCPSLQFLQSFFQNMHCIKRVLDTESEWLSLFQLYRKTFLRSVYPKQSKMSNLHFDLSLKLSQGEVQDFSGEVQKFSGEVQNDLRGGTHLPTPRLKIRPSCSVVSSLHWIISMTNRYFKAWSYTLQFGYRAQ